METARKPNIVTKYLLLYLKIIGGIALFILIAGVIITAVFGNDIKQFVITQINKQLVTEVKVNGEIDFSLFKNFPYASITFNNVEIRESYTASKNNLLKTEKIALLFNVLDIWRKNYTIKKIIVGKGDLSIIVNEEGQPNYNIFKTGGTDTSEFSVHIQNIIFKDLNARYQDNHSNQQYQFLFHEGNLSGIFSSSEFSLKLKSSFFCKHLFIGPKDYLTEKEVELNTEFLINTTSKIYKVENADLTIQRIPLKVNGTVENRPNSTYLDFIFTGNKLGLESLAGIIPNEYGRYLKEFHTKGTLTFNGAIKGDMAGKINPNVSFHFSIKNGSITNDKMSTSFENVNLDATYSNGKDKNLHSSVIAINDGHATMKGKALSLSFELKDFIRPYVSFKINTTIDLKEIFPILHLQDVEDMSGTLALNNCYFSGYASQLNSTINLNTTQSGGEITITNGQIVSKRANLQNLDGNFTLNRNFFSVNRFSLTTGNSDLNVSGSVTNLIPYLLQVASDSTKRIPVIIDLTVNSNRLNWEELLKPQTNQQTNTTPSQNVIPTTFDILSGKVSVNVNHFAYQKFKGDNIHGTIVFTPMSILFNNISLAAENGTVTGNGTLNKANKNVISLQSSFVLTNIDINRLFYECNNWGQTEITDRNLKGVLNTSFVLTAGWKKATFDPNQLTVLGDITIEKGELNNFEPMRALSKFVKISELENIRFSKLQNQVQIKNSTIFIPAMNIFTNAINLELSGSHTFKNIIDYKIKLNLLQLMTNKLKTRQFDPDATEHSPDGLLNLFISMKGPADNPVIQYDKKAVKEKIKKDMAVEKQTLKRTLKQEFSSQQQRQQQQIKDWKAPQEYEYMQFDTSKNDDDAVPATNAPKKKRPF